MLDFDVDIDASKVIADLNGYLDSIDRPSRFRFLRRTGVRMMRSIQMNFEQEGRPTPWPSLSPMTIARRPKGQQKHPKILRSTGKLYRSITYGVDPGGNFVEIGTNDVRAPDLQKGNSRRALPPRPFVMFQDKDILRIERDAQGFLSGRLGKGTYYGK